MPKISGLEFAKQISNTDCLIIFTTGKSEYAIDAFETNVVDYLLKPIDLPKLQKAIYKIQDLKEKQPKSNEPPLNFFFLKYSYIKNISEVLKSFNM